MPEGKTFADLSSLFLDHKRNQERHMDAIDLRTRNLGKHFAEVRLEDITAESIDGYISKRKAEGVKNATINRELAVLRHMLRLAVRKWRWLRQEPYFELLREGPPQARGVGPPTSGPPNGYEAGRAYPLDVAASRPLGARDRF